MKRDNSSTKQFLVEAGLTAGMRVLEIGCGGGEVTQLLAELVGPAGSVVAVDRSEDAIKAAQAHLNSQGINNVQFVATDLSSETLRLETTTAAPFDALAGRRVLMYLQDPTAVLRRLFGLLRSGGLVAFEESDSTMIPGRIAAMPAHDQACRWLKDMLIAEKANPSMGMCLPSTLAAAGARIEKVRAVAVIQGQGTQFPLADMLQIVAPRLIASGIATSVEVKLLAAQLIAEAADPNQVFISDVSFCAWGHCA